VSTPSAAPRNPGPSWGYGFLLWAERWWPRWFFRPLLLAGVWIGYASLPVQRRYSRDYLTVALGRPPRVIEGWRHFLALTDALLLKLRAGRGVAVDCRLEPENAAAFEALVASDRPALFGTFHFGHSDLLGYLLGARGRKVSIVRLKVGNSTDTQLLGRQFGDKVSFLWVNNPADMLFDLKAAFEAGESLAMKCDRLEFTARTDTFPFLGARRTFPFTIYHLAVLFERPVVFCLAVPGEGRNALRVYASPVFEPDPTASRAANLARAHDHFQGVLAQLETQLRANPYLWFNFGPLNPATAPAA